MQNVNPSAERQLRGLGGVHQRTIRFYLLVRNEIKNALQLTRATVATLLSKHPSFTLIRLTGASDEANEHLLNDVPMCRRLYM